MSKSNKIQQNIRYLIELKQDIAELPFREKDALTSLLKKIAVFSDEVYGSTNPYKIKIQNLKFVPDSFYSTPQDYKDSWNEGVENFTSLIYSMLDELGYEPPANEKGQPLDSDIGPINEDIFPTIPSHLETSKDTEDTTESNELKIVFSPSTYETPKAVATENDSLEKNRLTHLFKINKNGKTLNKKEEQVKKDPAKTKPNKDIYRSRIDEYMQKQIHKTKNLNPNKFVSILMLPLKLIGQFFKMLWKIADDFATLVEKDFKEFNKPNAKKLAKQKAKQEKEEKKALERTAQEKQKREEIDETNKK